MRVDITNAGDTMLIKTTHDDGQTQYFVSFSDNDDTDHDHSMATIHYKTWAINTGSKMINQSFFKKYSIMDAK